MRASSYVVETGGKIRTGIDIRYRNPHGDRVGVWHGATRLRKRAILARRFAPRHFSPPPSFVAATRKLAKLYREEGEDEKAARCYQRLVGGGSGDDALDAGEAEALLFLAQHTFESGNYEAAMAYCSKVRRTDASVIFLPTTPPSSLTRTPPPPPPLRIAYPRTLARSPLRSCLSTRGRRRTRPRLYSGTFARGRRQDEHPSRK